MRTFSKASLVKIRSILVSLKTDLPACMCFVMNARDYFNAESGNEKELRASLKSEVQKLMSKEDVVILDSLNYIKGYRYELCCISKLTQTPQCVVSWLFFG